MHRVLFHVDETLRQFWPKKPFFCYPGVTNPTAKEFFEATSDAAAAASVKADAQAAPTSGMAGLPSRQGVNEASTGRPVTRGAAAARCSPDVTISSSGIFCVL